MRVVVVGATGNVGTSLLQALARDPSVDSVLGLARRTPPPRGDVVEWAAADVVRSDLVPRFRGADVVVHLAWLIQPSRDLRMVRAVNVDGSERVFRAVAEAGVPSLVCASSVGTYSPGPKLPRVDESWPTDGVRTSFYARHKAAVERLLDRFEREQPDVRVVRLRPGLVFKREAAQEVRRLFAGPLLPSPLIRRSLIPVLPAHPKLQVQAVHSLDVGEAYRLAATGDARGAFNVAAEPVLDARTLAEALGARPLPVPRALLRGAVDLSWRLHLQPTPAGWLDLALETPLMDTTRATRELGWRPERSALEAFRDVLAGIAEGAGADTPPLARDAGGRARLGELLSGVGRRS